ncbi:MAG: hypothetical protein RL172_272 [Bacteroidota bacterium]|jgi:hypothetical protein
MQQYNLPAFIVLLTGLVACQYSKAQVAGPMPADSLLKVADFIKTKNGNSLLGRLKSGALGKIIFEIVDVEEDPIKLKDIAVIRAKSGQFEVDVKGHKRITGTIETTGQPGYFKINNGTDSIQGLLTDIILIKRIELKLMERLDGYLGVGYSYTSASGISRFNFTNALIYGTEKIKLFQHSATLLTLGDGQDGVDRIDAGVGGLLGIKGKYLALQYFQYQKILATGIDTRWLSLTGGGIRLVHSRALDFSLLTGISFMREKTVKGVLADIESEIPLMADFKLGISIPKLSITNAAIFYKSLTSGSRYRFDERLKIDYELIKNFTFGAQLLYNHDSKPIDITQKKSDVNISLNLGYKF